MTYKGEKQCVWLRSRWRFFIVSLLFTGTFGVTPSPIHAQAQGTHPGNMSGDPFSFMRLSALHKAYHWGFKKSQNGVVPSIEQEHFASFIGQTQALYVGSRTEKTLYLTFDNGYEAGYTAKILDVLKEKRVPAVFFVTGQYIQAQPHLLRRMVNEGHAIGNHSWSHPDMTTLNDQAQATQLHRVRQAVATVTGSNHMLFYRPPRGIFNASTLHLAEKLGYVPVFWSVAYKDWLIDRQQGEVVAHLQVMSQLHPGAIILLHAVSADNASALGRIIEDAWARGYSFRKVEELVFPEGTL